MSKALSSPHLVLLAGGTGTRCWPFSSQKFPKQFQNLIKSQKSLLQLTVDLFKDIICFKNIWIVTHNDYLQLIKQQLPFLKEEQILLEPLSRNTALCIAYACYKIAIKHPHAMLVISPIDYTVKNIQLFQQTILKAIKASFKEELFITLSTPCKKPEVDYGYVQIHNNVGRSKQSLQKVLHFFEKPLLKEAKKYVKNKNFFLNLGIFITPIELLKKQIKYFLPQIHIALELGKKKYFSKQETAFIQHVYQAKHIKCISFEKAILEKFSDLYTIIGGFVWYDLGSWKAIYEYFPKDENGNVSEGKNLLLDTKNCLVKTSNTFVVIFKVKNLIIAEYKNKILICDKRYTSKLKNVLKSAQCLRDKE